MKIFSSKRRESRRPFKIGSLATKVRRIMAVSALLAAAGIAGAAVAQPKASPDAQASARFCQINRIEVAAPLDRDGACVAPAYLNEGGGCVYEQQAHNVFQYREREDKSIDFGLSYWFGGGAHCGIIGNAVPAARGWRYEGGMNSDFPDEKCIVDITVEGDMILFDADTAASCRAQCGAAAYLDGVFIAFSALEPTKVTDASFAPEAFYNTPCIGK